MAFIYCIENKINHKKYIGETIRPIEARWKAHLRDWKSKRRGKEKRPIYDAFTKYGIENFKIFQLEECSDTDRWDRERYWVEYYNTFKGNGYNACAGSIGTERCLYTDEEVRQSYLELKSITKVAKALSLSTDTVRAKLSKYVESGELVLYKPNARILTEEEILEINRLNALGVSGRKLKKMFHTSQEKLNEVITDKRKINVDSSDVQQIIELYTSGKTITELSKIVNFSVDTISKVLKTNGIDIKKSNIIMKEKYAKKVRLEVLSKGLILIFPSLHDTARYIHDNFLYETKLETIVVGVRRACKGQRSEIYRKNFKLSFIK